ncbi:hypothetical protein PUN28_019924 [Cardiocondyla obscurior]|uniref:Uncharacterized protein n=1 Tax=Cardiocondyla obscurior TaxID=286306 RepID=A0AAW2EC68_9HYME
MNLRRRCYESTDKTSTGYLSLCLLRQLGELCLNLSFTCCCPTSGSQKCRLRNDKRKILKDEFTAKVL